MLRIFTYESSKCCVCLGKFLVFALSFREQQIGRRAGRRSRVSRNDLFIILCALRAGQQTCRRSFLAVGIKPVTGKADHRENNDDKDRRDLLLKFQPEDLRLNSRVSGSYWRLSAWFDVDLAHS